jgi:hypothetical protein
MTDATSAPPNSTATPGADAGVGQTPLSPAEQQIVARDADELFAAGKLTKAQRDEAIKQAAGSATPGSTPPPADAPAPATTPEAVKTAQAEIDRLVGGADKEWLVAYLDKNAPGHQAAVDKMTALHQAAFPESAEAADAAPAMGTQSHMPFEFDAGTAPARMAEVNTAAHEVIAALQIDPSLARGAVQTLDRAVNQRRMGPDGRGAPKPMDQLELAKMEAMLQQRWGSGYNAKFDAVERAIARAGKHGQWLKQTILHAGPIAAVWACETLASQGARLAPGQTG